MTPPVRDAVVSPSASAIATATTAATPVAAASPTAARASRRARRRRSAPPRASFVVRARFPFPPFPPTRLEYHSPGPAGGGDDTLSVPG